MTGAGDDLDPRLVALYDQDNPDRRDHDFYRAIAHTASVHSILDLGCGTGLLTVTLANDGRQVIGVDPDAAMIDHARRRSGAEAVRWIHGDSTAVPDERLDLAIMSGNVVQHIDDNDWSRTLRDLRSRMRPGGIVTFESRNPLVREWETWNSPTTTRQTPSGTLREWMEVDEVDQHLVTFSAWNHFIDTDETLRVTQTLAFRSLARIEGDLAGAGFGVEQVLGDWSGRPFEESARVMIFTAQAR